MEEKKKILLFAYTKPNLGDNLFINMLLKRYTNIEFYIHVIEKDYEKIYKDFKNINFIYTERNLQDVNIDEFDSFIYVGGSIFMESEYAIHELNEFNYFIKRCNQKNKKFYYMSCNFGPYKTQEYLNLAKETFKICGGICFRDRKSYNLFKDIETVSYAPDMVFSLKMEETTKINKSIGISVINLHIRENLKEKEDIYNDFIKRIIIKFAKRNYNVYLFSFSEFEQDSVEINEIMDSVPNEYKDKVNIIKFEENIDEFIKIYSQMQYMVAGRFHSMILSILFGQKIYNLTYSQKQDNVIKELRLFNRYQRIIDLEYSTILRKYYFKRVCANKLSKISKKAENQFLNLDNWILGN